jgi:hypothetical protein
MITEPRQRLSLTGFRDHEGTIPAQGLSMAGNKTSFMKLDLLI